jgi:hypothetical protein
MYNVIDEVDILKNELIVEFANGNKNQNSL